jgi:hypothetical protein
MSDMSSLPPSRDIIFSENNHWRFGWGDGLYNFHEQDQPLWVTFGPCRRKPGTLDVEIAAAARAIADAATKPIYVAMSGGIDSELVARVMLRERIPFTPVIARFEKNFNAEDIAFAFDFCRLHNLEPTVVDVDILALFRDSINTPYVLANCAHILQMHIMRHIAGLGGMAVIGVGEQRYDNQDGRIFVPVPLERIAVTHFMQAEGVRGISAFYCYTPELMLCLLREAKAHGFEGMSRFAHNIKEDIYRKYWPDLTPRPKYSGFEMVATRRRAAQQLLLKKYGSLIVHYGIPLDELEQQLSGGQY